MATHVSMGYSLIMLLLAVSCLPYINTEMQATKQQLKEIDRYLKRMNKHAVKSIETPDGDIIDCVDIYHQPAFDHPLLKNHTIQMRPSSYPFGVNDKEKLASEKGTGSVFQTWRRYGQCPENTVPIRRMKRDDLLRARSARRFSRLSHRTGPYPILPHNDYGPEYARAGLQGELYRGANAVMDVWSPSTEEWDVSKSSITLMTGSGLEINLIEAGWTVDRRRYNDDKPRFTACWTRDDFTETGCFNLECSGFVQTSNKVELTAAIEPVSTYGGTRYEIYVGIHQDASTKDWWLAFQDEMVGYFPNSLFTSLGDGASYVFWGGTVSTSTALSDPHTTTVMGSGHFPEENYELASEIKRIQYLDSAWAMQWPTKLGWNRNKPNCYNLTIGEIADDFKGVYIQYGGPGRNHPNCP